MLIFTLLFIMVSGDEEELSKVERHKLYRER